MNTKRMLRSLSWIAAIALVLLGSVTTGASANSADHVRWDIFSLNFSTGTASPGGVASALAEDGSKITFTESSGTFVAPAGGTGRSSAATGGGNWTTYAPDGTTVTGSGIYEVTGLVLWEQAPGTFPLPTDLIGDIAETSAGLAVLTVEYSDGERGILVVSCHLGGTPNSVFEGVNASKGFVHYYDNVAPLPGVDANRTLFHVRQ
jgi:hypothetical protein